MAAHGIRFDETMAGPFALGATDTNEGADRGKSDKTTLSMHASVAIDDVDAFVADPNHLGSLTGTIDFGPFGNGLKAESGVFNLFSPTDHPDTKHMIYELAFEHEGKSLYLAGHKVVHNDRPFDLWPDTTTLFTKLYEGQDKSGAIAGAGVLSLGLVDLMKLVSTIRVTGTDDLIDKSAAMAKFGRFFMGELWDRYGPKVR